MPRMRAASKPSRSVMTKVPPMGGVRRLLGDDPAGRGLVEVVEEGVAAGLQRADADVDGLAGRHDLLDAEVLALELRRLGALVRHDEHERRVGLDLDLARLELVLVDRERNFRRRIGRHRGARDRHDADQESCNQERERSPHRIPPTLRLTQINPPIRGELTCPNPNTLSTALPESPCVAGSGGACYHAGDRKGDGRATMITATVRYQ